MRQYGEQTEGGENNGADAFFDIAENYRTYHKASRDKKTDRSHILQAQYHPNAQRY